VSSVKKSSVLLKKFWRNEVAKVFIINDRFELGSKQDVMVVNSVSNYVDTYIQIVNSIHDKTILNVLVRDPTCFKWLSHLKEQYGFEYIEIQEYTPRKAIKRLWNIQHLPDYIKDRDILESKLLESEIVPKEGESFQNIILDRFCSSLLVYPELPIGKLVELLRDLANSKWQDNKKIPLIFRIYEKRLDEWKKKAKRKEFEDIIEALRNNPRILKQQLMCYKLVKNYPSELSERILGKRYDAFKKLPLDLNNLVIEKKSIEKKIYEIEIFLHNELQVKTLEDIETLLTIISGELPVEFYTIREAIYNLENLVTKELIEKVKDKFSAISDQISTDLKELDLIIPPLKPSEPKDSWDAEEWTNWAINEYLPYHFWLEERNKYEKEIASFSERFGDWFYNNFLELKISFPRVLHKAVPNICHEIRNGKEISLVLMIDNFNFKYIEELCTLFNQQGFFYKELQAYLSMIPTETEVCKKSLFSGEPEITILGSKTYKKIIKEAWSEFIESKKFIYLPNLGTLNEVRKPYHDVYFLNYRGIDELLHEDEGKIGKPHREEVWHRLGILVNLVVNFGKRLGIEHKLSIYICSDHGSTKIPTQVSNPIDRKYYDTKSEDKHHRFVSLSDMQIQNLPSHVESNCYIVRKEEYGLLKNILIAKGYNRFKRTTGKFYVHGGLSPEEVIVPFTVFRKIITEPREILVHLSENIFRYSVKSTIRFYIENINDYEIVNVVIDVRNSNVKCESPKVTQIESKGRAQIEIPARFKKTLNKRETNYLLMRIRYQFLGKDYSQDEDIPIVIKSMVERKTDMKELF